MTPPTKEQIEAAKAFGRYDETHEQFAMVRDFDTPKPHCNAITILLAALGAAEQDSARLAKSLEWAVRQLDGEDEDERERGGCFFHRDAKGYGQCVQLLAARKAQP